MGTPIKIRGVSHPLKGFSRGLGVVKGEAKVLPSFVASQTMIYIVLLLRYSAAKKRSPSHLKKKEVKLKIQISPKFQTH